MHSRRALDCRRLARAPAFWGGTDYFAKFLEPVFRRREAAGAAAAAEAAAHALELPLAVSP